jgi:hypothetical protein
MLDFATSLLKTDQKYRRYLKIAGLFLVFGYISLLTFIFVAFNKHDRHYQNAELGANTGVSQPLEMKKARTPFGDRANSTSVWSGGDIQCAAQRSAT